MLRIRPPAATVRGGALARAYERIDRRLFANADDSLAASELPLARALPEVDANAAEAIRAARLDVLLWLADPPGPDGLADRLGCEIWCVRVGEGGAEFPLFRELLVGDPVSSLSLVRLARGGRPAELLARSFGATDFSSAHRGRATVLAKAPGLVRRSLQARVSAAGRESQGAPREASPSAQPDRATGPGGVLRIAAGSRLAPAPQPRPEPPLRRALAHGCPAPPQPLARRARTRRVSRAAEPRGSLLRGSHPLREPGRALRVLRRPRLRDGQGHAPLHATHSGRASTRKTGSSSSAPTTCPTRSCSAGAARSG